MKEANANEAVQKELDKVKNLIKNLKKRLDSDSDNEWLLQPKKKLKTVKEVWPTFNKQSKLHTKSVNSLNLIYPLSYHHC